MKFRIKLMCCDCNNNFYVNVEAKGRKEATRLKKSFKKSSGLIHFLIKGCKNEN